MKLLLVADLGEIYNQTKGVFSLALSVAGTYYTDFNCLTRFNMTERILNTLLPINQSVFPFTNILKYPDVVITSDLEYKFNFCSYDNSIREYSHNLSLLNFLKGALMSNFSTVHVKMAYTPDNRTLNIKVFSTMLNYISEQYDEQHGEQHDDIPLLDIDVEIPEKDNVTAYIDYFGKSQNIKALFYDTTKLYPPRLSIYNPTIVGIYSGFNILNPLFNGLIAKKFNDSVLKNLNHLFTYGEITNFKDYLTVLQLEKHLNLYDATKKFIEMLHNDEFKNDLTNTINYTFNIDDCLIPDKDISKQKEFIYCINDLDNFVLDLGGILDRYKTLKYEYADEAFKKCFIQKQQINITSYDNISSCSTNSGSLAKLKINSLALFFYGVPSENKRIYKTLWI